MKLKISHYPSHQRDPSALTPREDSGSYLRSGDPTSLSLFPQVFLRASKNSLTAWEFCPEPQTPGSANWKIRQEASEASSLWGKIWWLRPNQISKGPFMRWNTVQPLKLQRPHGIEKHAVWSNVIYALNVDIPEELNFHLKNNFQCLKNILNKIHNMNGCYSLLYYEL